MILLPGEPNQPEPPVKQSVPLKLLEEYFQSIQEPFSDTCDGLERDGKGLSVAAIVFFIFSLISLLPLVASKLAWRYFGSAIVRFRVLHFHLGSFWFWWVALFVVSLVVLLLVVKVSGVSTGEKKKWLSAPQLRFAYCYAVADEIKKYRTNQLGRHIDTALEYLEKIADSIDFYPDQYIRRDILIAQHRGLGIDDSQGATRPRWFRLTSETELVLKAFSEFTPKLRDRIKDRKDLLEIETMLTYLAFI